MSFFDDRCMREALDLAKFAASKGDIPVGAVIYDPDEKQIIGRGYNQQNISYDPTAHAEILAIRSACKTKKKSRLYNCYIYITLEPCLMCTTAISYARLSRIYYGSTDSKCGALESGINIFNTSLSLYEPDTYGGILSKESSVILKKYFRDLRNRR